MLFLFFLFCSFCSSPTNHSHADPCQPKSRDHRCQSSITRRKALPCARSPHCCYRTRSSIWSEHQNWHPQQRWISVGNNLIWKLLCRHQEQLHWKRFYWVLLFLDSFYFILFGGVWSFGNYEWSFCDYGVWILWLNYEWSFCVKLWLWWWQNEMSREENGGKWGWGG